MPYRPGEGSRAVVLAAIAVGLVLLTAAPASAVEPLLVRDGDRVTGTFREPGEEVALCLDALVGTRLSVTVKAAGGSLRPELRLYDPDRVAVTGTSVRGDSRKARLKRFVLPTTGRYTILVLAAPGATGDYRMKIEAMHPETVREEGTLVRPGVESLVRIPALAGTTARIKVKGREGLTPRLERMLDPDAHPRLLEDVAADGTKVRAGPVALDELGDHRLVVQGAHDTTGRWKAKVRLTHPTHDRQKLVADSWPAGTFRDTLYETRDEIRVEPPPPGPPFGWTKLVSGTYSEITSTLTTVIRSQEAYLDLLSRVNREDETWPVDPDISVDFSRYIVVGIFLGQRPTWDYGMHIEITRESYGVRVWWFEVTPSPCSIFPPDESQPWTLIRVTRVNGPVVFDRAATRPDGCRLPSGD